MSLWNGLCRALTVVLLVCSWTAECSVTTVQPNSTLNSEPGFTNGTGGEPRVLAMLKPCEANLEGFCVNGKCLYAPDLEPFCRCEPNFTGNRCQHATLTSQGLRNTEEITGITCGVVLLITFIGVLLYCICRKRCWNIPLQYKSYSQNSV